MRTVHAPAGPVGPTIGRGRPLLSYGWFVLGVLGLAAGLGVALPRLTKEGLTPTAVIGLMGLVLAVGVAGRAGWRLLGAIRRRWWALWLPLLLVTTYLALWTVGQGLAAGWPAHPPLGDRTPASVGLVYDEVTVPTSDGVDLAAWWVPSRNGAAVALLHGAGSTRTAALGQAEVLADAGYGVLLVDARGHGGSGGRGMDFGWWGERDAAAAVDFLAERAAPDRIGLVGLSMGGESAIGAAGADLRVRAVVAEGATHRIAADKAYLDEYGVRGEVQQLVDRLTYGVAALVSAAPQPRPLLEAVASSPARMLLVTAGERPDERLAAMRLRSAAPDRVEVWTVEGAGHTRGLATAPREWRDRVVGFLDDALASRGS